MSKKRPFGYFCGSGQKLPAQQGGKMQLDTKRLNRAKKTFIASV